jgi:four helix bundle protein
VKSYRELLVWQKAMDLVVEIYATAALLPENERFGLVGQLRRAAVSIPSVLAEGYARSSTKEFAHYVAIALGSLAEIETQILIAARLKMLTETTTSNVLLKCTQLGLPLRGLQKALLRKIAATRPAPSPQSLAAAL